MNIQSLISKLKQAKKRRVIFDYHRSPKNGVDISTEDWIWIAPFLYGLFKELKSMKYTITITWWGEIFVIYKGVDTAFELTLNYQSSVPYTYEFTQRVRDKTYVIHTISTRQTALNLGLKAYRTGTKWFYIPLRESTVTPASAACKINEVMQARQKEYSFAGWSVKPDIATSDDIAAVIHYRAALFGLGSRFDYISKKLLELIIYQDIELTNNAVHIKRSLYLSGYEFYLDIKHLSFIKKYLPPQ